MLVSDQISFKQLVMSLAHVSLVQICYGSAFSLHTVIKCYLSVQLYVD